MAYRFRANDIEIAVANLIGWRTHTIVPNVSWGLGLRHECDMLILDQKNRFTEVEIKVTVSDMKADLLKPHGHASDIISRLVYAMPISVYEKVKHLIPNHAGVITVEHTDFDNGDGINIASWHTIPRHNVKRVPDEKQIRQFMNLGCMRIWSLKQKLSKL